MKNKIQLQGEIKSTGTAFIMYWFLWSHYAYLGKWGVQIAYWLTIGGFGMWALVDMFRISGMVKRHNNLIYAQIEEVEEEKEQKKMEMIAMITRR